MTVEIRPLDTACNLQCQYCYQHPQRDADNRLGGYSIDKMKAAVERFSGPFTLFGGEALLVDRKDLEDLWSWGYEKFGRNSVQTNGVLIDEVHIDLFKRYRVHVGISIDGPGALNDIRWAGSLKETRAATAKTMKTIERLGKENIGLSVIVTLHRGNATQDKLAIMHDWFHYLESAGVGSARLHIMEVDHEAVREKYGLSDEENIQAFLSFAELEKKLHNIQFDKLKDIRGALQGKDKQITCIWNACDCYATSAVQDISGHGQVGNCGRTNKDGIEFMKADFQGFERYLALYHTPQEFNGCQGCRFFLVCKGQCPGTAVNGDWRNRSEYCAVWKGLIRYMEDDLLDKNQQPVTARPDRQLIEQQFLDAWSCGRNLTIARALESLTNQDPEEAISHCGSSHGDKPHGDRPHGDSHGDHTDAGK